MSKSERKLLDTTGRFTQVVRDGTKLNDISWTDGRILLSNRRLVLAGTDGKQTIKLTNVDKIEGRYDVNRTIAQVTDYVSIRVGTDVFLVSTKESESFERTLHKTILDGEIVLIKHPAIEGGVVQDVSWRKARIKVDEDAVNLAVEDGSFVQIEIDDVGTVERNERQVKSKERPVLEAEHTEDETSVETYLSGNRKHCSVVESVLKRGAEQNASSIDLSKDEEEVLMALYSGVSPFEVPEFLDMDPDAVEEIYERLIDLDVLQEVRIRREVALKPRGRNIASESMNSQ
ncbi:taxis protein CheF1 [Natronomonas pharaonis DSM 2160]|uniref:Taxis protein CheF n=1 Tax=Natronomonas pharaonis (strain ATCC 35678 / DSM 2160 / CIP 103997 / JCM 8858 / NBRC 14720 / NCIMB 2260 / Gabara) TaxID=348780 RepID=A0A1U7EVT8_NATPD|nr:CheF family chemotaxis protein [Natronomonas pharaonis]CAI49174.1 taxis protein CheF1 [Natronomonas pharaonis DSM 2160]